MSQIRKKIFEQFVENNAEIKTYISNLYQNNDQKAFEDANSLARSVAPFSFYKLGSITAFASLCVMGAVSIIPIIPPILMFFAAVPAGIFYDCKIALENQVKVEEATFTKIKSYITEFNRQSKDVEKPKYIKQIGSHSPFKNAL